MQGIHLAEGIADEQEERERRVATETGLVLTTVDILTGACFPLPVGGTFAGCIITDEVGRIRMRALDSQVSLIRQAVVEEGKTVAHTYLLEDRVVVDTRDANHGTYRIQVVGQFAEQVFLMQHGMHLKVHKRLTLFRFQVGFIGEDELVLPTVIPIARCRTVRLRTKGRSHRILIGLVDGLRRIRHVVDIPVDRVGLFDNRRPGQPADDRAIADDSRIQPFMSFQPLIPLTLIPAVVDMRQVVGRLGHHVLRIRHKERVAEGVRRITEGI